MRAGSVAYGVLLNALFLAACTSTTIQGYADRDLPAKPLQHLAAYVAAPEALASSMQASIAQEGQKKCGALVEDALTILPPTRTYTDAEVRKLLGERGVDGAVDDQCRGQRSD